MELGLNFDDGDFPEEEKQKPVLISYNAKICKPKWFLNPVSQDEKEDMATICKFRADYHYSVGEYEQAVECYYQSLDCLGSQNRSMRREIVESLARCYIQTGDLAKALQYSNKMLEDCLTSAHFCQALLLQHQIQKTSGKLLDEIQVLHQLIHLHSFHHQFWLMLAQAYSKLHTNKEHVMNMDKLIGSECLNNSESKTDVITMSKGMKELEIIQTETEQIDSSNTATSDKGKPKAEQNEEVCAIFQTVKSDNEHGSCTGSRSEIHVDLEPVVNGLSQSKLLEKGCKELVETSLSNVDCDKTLSNYPLELVKLTCLVRVRLILQSSLRNTSSFVTKNIKETLIKVGEDIKDLTTDEGLLHTVTEFMRKDMFDDEYGAFSDKSSQENEPQNGVTSPIPTEDFNKRWFSWINRL